MTEEVTLLLKKITKAQLDGTSLLEVFTPYELDTILIAEEAASIATLLAHRPISTDYIKRMRLGKRLPAKKINERAYVYRLRDLLLVRYRKPYTRKPPGRPKKQYNEFSVSG